MNIDQLIKKVDEEGGVGYRAIPQQYCDVVSMSTIHEKLGKPDHVSEGPYPGQVYSSDGSAMDLTLKYLWYGRVGLGLQGDNLWAIAYRATADREKDEEITPRIRTWTDATGTYHTEAEFLSLRGGQVHLKKRNGNVVTVPIERLSVPDQEYVRKQAALPDKPGRSQQDFVASPIPGDLSKAARENIEKGLTYFIWPAHTGVMEPPGSGTILHVPIRFAANPGASQEPFEVRLKLEADTPSGNRVALTSSCPGDHTSEDKKRDRSIVYARIFLLMTTLKGEGNATVDLVPKEGGGKASLKKAISNSVRIPLRFQETGGAEAPKEAALRISAAKTEKVAGGYSTTLNVSRPAADVAIPAKTHALVFYLRGAEPGEASDLAARAAAQGDLAAGMASGDGKGFDGLDFFSCGSNFKREGEPERSGAFMWISLPARPEYDLAKQSTIRIPVGAWLLNGLSFEGSGRCAIALGTLKSDGPKKMPTFHAVSTTVEIEVAF
jgi:hypothetical protein